MPTLEGKMRARRAEIRKADMGSLELDPAAAGLSGSPTRVVRIFHPTVTRKAEVFSGRDTDAGIERFIEALRERALTGR
jgi:electron transfer flavoprotein beta subunit